MLFLNLILFFSGKNLWQNACNIKHTVLTIFRCASQWHREHSYCCVTKTTIHLQNSVHFAKPLNSLLSPLNNSPFPLPTRPPPLATTILLSVSMNVTDYTSCKWHDTVFTFQRLAYFTRQNVFKVH